MSAFSRIEVELKMRQTGLVPLFYHPDPGISKQVVQACYKGGARVFEFTNRGDFAHETFAELQKFVQATLPELCLGVGSVTDAPTAALFMQMGASFVVSPSYDEAIARICNRRKLLWIPGCSTPTEIATAEEMGAGIVKLFPASSAFGPGFIRALKGPMPWSAIMPTGGIEPTPESIRPWIVAGAPVIGMGSALISRDILMENNFEVLEERVRNVITWIQKLRLSDKAI